MIFEGNDLENDYATENDLYRISPKPQSLDGAIKNTVVETLLNFPQILKEQSVIHQFRKGLLTVKIPTQTTVEESRKKSI